MYISPSVLAICTNKIKHNWKLIYGYYCGGINHDIFISHVISLFESYNDLISLLERVFFCLKSSIEKISSIHSQKIPSGIFERAFRVTCLRSVPRRGIQEELPGGKQSKWMVASTAHCTPGQTVKRNLLNCNCKTCQIFFSNIILLWFTFKVDKPWD